MSGAPLAIDLFCGLGGWTEGLLAEGWRVIGFDTERHQYGDQKYPAQMVIQDVLTIHGAQFKDASLIVASPPCQAYSYRAMPWKRAKALGPPDNTLFESCFRIQREAEEAAGRHIPLVVENVRGAQKWVGKAKWNFGSFYLWGDVPALMPITKRVAKGTSNFHFFSQTGLPLPSFHGAAHEPSVIRHDAIKNTGGSWFAVANNTTSGHSRNPVVYAEKRLREGEKVGDGIKQGGIGGVRTNGLGDSRFQDGAAKHGSKSSARKAASAQIAKIPFVLSRHIASVYKPHV